MAKMNQADITGMSAKQAMSIMEVVREWYRLNFFIEDTDEASLNQSFLAFLKYYYQKGGKNNGQI